MIIDKLIFRRAQTSILRKWSQQVQALFSVTHNGEEGHFLYEAIFCREPNPNKAQREPNGDGGFDYFADDDDVQYFSDLTTEEDDLIYDEDGMYEVINDLNYGGVYLMKPEHTEITPSIQQIIDGLYDKEIG